MYQQNSCLLEPKMGLFAGPPPLLHSYACREGRSYFMSSTSLAQMMSWSSVGSVLIVESGSFLPFQLVSKSPQCRACALPLCVKYWLASKVTPHCLRYPSRKARSSARPARVVRLFVWPRHTNGTVAVAPLDPCARGVRASGGKGEGRATSPAPSMSTRLGAAPSVLLFVGAAWLVVPGSLDGRKAPPRNMPDVVA